MKRMDVILNVTLSTWIMLTVVLVQAVSGPRVLDKLLREIPNHRLTRDLEPLKESREITDLRPVGLVGPPGREFFLEDLFEVVLDRRLGFALPWRFGNAADGGAANEPLRSAEVPLLRPDDEGRTVDGSYGHGFGSEGEGR